MTLGTSATVHRSRAAGRLPGASLLLAWAAIPAFFVPGLAARLEYERAAVGAGELWRLLTGHWTHWSLDHLVWDALAFLALAAACELRDRRRFALCLVGAALVVPLGIFWLQPGLEVYRGLSGLDSALFALLAVLVLRQQKAGARRWLVLGGAALFAAKVAWESLVGEPIFVEPGTAAFAVVPLAHLLGAAVGIVAGLGDRGTTASSSSPAPRPHRPAACATLDGRSTGAKPPIRHDVRLPATREPLRRRPPLADPVRRGSVGAAHDPRRPADRRRRRKAMTRKADSSTGTERARLQRAGVLSPLLLVALLSPSSSGQAGGPPTTPAPVTFERHEVVTGSAAGQTILTGFLLGGPVADLAVVQADGNGDCALRIYHFDGDRWEPRVEAKLGRGVAFVDVAEIGGRDRLLTYRPGRLSWFDPESATERALVEVTTRYNAAPSGLSYGGVEPTEPFGAGEIPHVDITRDLNRDRRDDLVVPDVDGFWVILQNGDGRFAEAVKLGPPEPFRGAFGFGEKRSYGQVGLTPLTIPWYLSRVHQMDFDRDGRSDLVFWNEDHFEVHRQDARGRFDPVAETFAADVPFDSDGAYSLIFGLQDASPFRLLFGLRKSTRQTVLHSFRDVNGDRVADLVTLSLEGRSLLKQHSLYEVHFGTATPDGIAFARDAGAAVRPVGKAPPGYSFARLEDHDGDGRLDIGFMTVRTGLGGMIRALLNTSISLSFEVYGVEDGVYGNKPIAKRTVKSDVDVRGGREAGFWPPVLTGDVNGDGRSDLLVGKDREELHVFLGGPDFLAGRPQKVAVALPGDERNSRLADLDRDGKQDLLLHHASATEPHRVLVLLAR